jgi:Spy/CpxP family protein refolding chaperone
MKKTVYLLLLLTVASTSISVAQRRGTPPPPRVDEAQLEQMVSRRVTHLTAELNLSEAQAASIRDLMMDRAQSMQSTMREHREREERVRAEGRTAYTEHMDETNEAIMALLDPEQQASFVSMNEERRERAQERRGDRRVRRQPD